MLTDLTTYITEEIEDKLTETLENTKDVHEFSYQQRKNKLKHSNDSVVDLETNMNQLIQAIEPNNIMEIDDMDVKNMANIQITTTREFEFSHQPNYNADNNSSSGISSGMPTRVLSNQNSNNPSRDSKESGESGSEEMSILKTNIDHRSKFFIFENWIHLKQK